MLADLRQTNDSSITIGRLLDSEVGIRTSSIAPAPTVKSPQEEVIEISSSTDSEDDEAVPELRLPVTGITATSSSPTTDEDNDEDEGLPHLKWPASNCNSDAAFATFSGASALDLTIPLAAPKSSAQTNSFDETMMVSSASPSPSSTARTLKSRSRRGRKLCGTSNTVNTQCESQSSPFSCSPLTDVKYSATKSSDGSSAAVAQGLPSHICTATLVHSPSSLSSPDSGAKLSPLEASDADTENRIALADDLIELSPSASPTNDPQVWSEYSSEDLPPPLSPPSGMWSQESEPNLHSPETNLCNMDSVPRQSIARKRAGATVSPSSSLGSSPLRLRTMNWHVLNSSKASVKRAIDVSKPWVPPSKISGEPDVQAETEVIVLSDVECETRMPTSGDEALICKDSSDRSDPKGETETKRKCSKLEKEEIKKRATAVRVAVRRASKKKTPGERMADLEMFCSQRIYNAISDSPAHARFTEVETKVNVADQAHSQMVFGDDLVDTVKWQRKIPRTTFEEIGNYDIVYEKHVVVIIQATTFVDAVANGKLIERIKVVETSLDDDCTTTIIIEGLDKFFRAQSSRENAEYRRQVLGTESKSTTSSRQSKRVDRQGHRQGITRMVAETALASVQIGCSVGIRLSAGPADTLSLLFMFTKAVAAKVDRCSDRSDLAFYPAVKNAAKIDRDDLKGLRVMWNKQLQQFHMLSESKATAIAKSYPSPRALLRAFKKGGPNALSNICVGTSTARRLGPAVSQKLYTFFMSSDPSVLIE